MKKLYIARTKRGFVKLFNKKPNWKKHNITKVEDWYGGFLDYLDGNKFPELTVENSPQEVELKIIDKIVKENNK